MPSVIPPIDGGEENRCDPNHTHGQGHGVGHSHGQGFPPYHTHGNCNGNGGSIDEATPEALLSEPIAEERTPVPSTIDRAISSARSIGEKVKTLLPSNRSKEESATS